MAIQLDLVCFAIIEASTRSLEFLLFGVLVVTTLKSPKFSILLSISCSKKPFKHDLF